MWTKERKIQLTYCLRIVIFLYAYANFKYILTHIAKYRWQESETIVSIVVRIILHIAYIFFLFYT